jgi:hypothetical protein
MGEDVLGDDKAAIDSSVQRGCGGVGAARSTTRRGCAVARRGQGVGEGSLGSREKGNGGRGRRASQLGVGRVRRMRRCARRRHRHSKEKNG